MSIDLSDIFQTDYNEIKPNYQRLGDNLERDLHDLMKKGGIEYLDVQSRIKAFKSFCEKVERKRYEKPFEEMEDICGLRIICYYVSDLDKITKIIQEEFDVVQSEDKSKLLEADRFGYRSLHFIVKIRKDWATALNYRGLSDFKAEIQVRTILMHAWADIEHKLAYKKREHVPAQLARKLSQLSALFEIADDRLNSLQIEKESYKEQLTIRERNGKTHFDFSQPLNVDSLTTFLDTYFPDRERESERMFSLQLDELLKNNISFEDLYTGYKKTKGMIPAIERKYFGRMHSKYERDNIRFPQLGIMRIILLLTNQNYWELWKIVLPPELKISLEEYRKLLK